MHNCPPSQLKDVPTIYKSPASINLFLLLCDSLVQYELYGIMSAKARGVVVCAPSLAGAWLKLKLNPVEPHVTSARNHKSSLDIQRESQNVIYYIRTHFLF